MTKQYYCIIHCYQCENIIEKDKIKLIVIYEDNSFDIFTQYNESEIKYSAEQLIPYTVINGETTVFTNRTKSLFFDVQANAITLHNNVNTINNYGTTKITVKTNRLIGYPIIGFSTYSEE